MRFPLTLALRPSPRLAILVAAIHSIAAIACLASSFPVPVRLALLAALAVSLAVALREEFGKSGARVVLDPTGAIAFASRGEPEPGTLGPGCADFGWAVWLHWRIEADDAGRASRRQALMILPDSIGVENWRALRIWIRHVAVMPGASRAATSDRAP